MKDMFGMMKQVQAMQEKFASLQAEVEKIDVEGRAGADLVKIVMSAKGQVKSIQIDDSLLKPEDKEILEDLLTAAFHDAKAKGESLMQEKMSALTAGLPIPTGLKLF